ncbi:MAG TPA: outer membrane lipoprotein-sorting protein [Halanaerobiaceae bacterium]|jgi:outer membrane lipoprotein-sorting protein|nr:outer membrane lipoprotein-sorting protein [Bacillota bacterium]HHU91583.1 outer membrane lipoprotein-sorting protein [Halanaerobiaceae bacterium]HOA40759.1 outer membrane lipoprotein-sorting protein [Halanaerobiales bacterium]HPZ62261.1 outer membrane lipoprotein-sorting protein [Halanaerobiales bacterium]HQD03583.1 outer membrane lipoprotein-sorting protein [Halanaerobiales bacterium]
MKRFLAFLAIFILLFTSSTFVHALTAEEIINKRDDNEYLETARAEMEMIIRSGRREMSKTMISLTDKQNSLTEFTNPRDRGTKFLKRGDELWMFFPDAEDIVKISGHMLNQGMMGSDFSYQDLMESDKLIDLYEFEIISEEEIDGRPCYVLEGLAREGKEVSYYKRKIWIDKERFVGLKEELYARSGRLLKELNVLQVEEIEGRWYPLRSVMEDKLRKDTSTEVILKAIEFNPLIPEGTFTLENLR